MSVENQIKALEKQVAQLSHDLMIVRDEQSVRRLQHIYGYYIDKCLYEEVIDLFTDDCEVRFMHGIYKGKAGARRLYVENFQKRFTGGKNGPVYGFLLDHPMYQDVITIAPDGLSAKARFRCNMQAGTHETAVPPGSPTRQWWEGSLYENEYAKENGIWKIKVLNYNPVWHADFETGWAHTRPEYVKFADESQLYPKNPTGPDAIEKFQVLWPDHGVLTFHYPHPVTGKKFKPQKPSLKPKKVKPSAASVPMGARPAPAPTPAKPSEKAVAEKAPIKTGASKPGIQAPAAKPAIAPTAAKPGSRAVAEKTPVKTGARTRA